MFSQCPEKAFMRVTRCSLCVATSQRVFLTAHLFYFTFLLTSIKVLTSNSNLQQFYNGGGRGGKIGDFPERPCRQDQKKSRFVPALSLSFVSWSPQREEVAYRVLSCSSAPPLGQLLFHYLLALFVFNYHQQIVSVFVRRSSGS